MLGAVERLEGGFQGAAANDRQFAMAGHFRFFPSLQQGFNVFLLRQTAHINKQAIAPQFPFHRRGAGGIFEHINPIGNHRHSIALNPQLNQHVALNLGENDRAVITG